VERSTAGSSDVSVAVADLMSSSGADWANRDSQSPYRRIDADPAPYRRPPAVNSFRDDADEEDMADSPSWSAFGSPTTPESAAAHAARAHSSAAHSAGAHSKGAETPEPEFGPAPPHGPGRASFGFTAGPISGNRPTSGAPFAPAPTSPAPHPVRSVTAESVLAQSHPDLARADLGRPDQARADLGRPDQGRADLGRPDQGRPLPSASSQYLPARRRPPAQEDEGIGDFIGGPGREIRPHRAVRHPETPAEHAVAPAAPRRRRGVMVAGVALTLAVLLGGTVAGVAYFSGSDSDLTSVLELGAGKSEGNTVTAPIDGRTAASFELLTAVTKVTMRSEDLGDQLYRMSTAEDAGVAPKPVLSQDRVRLSLVPHGDGTTGAVEVVLSSKVMWTLRFSGATDEQIVNFTGGQVGGIDLVGGSRVTDIALPPPAGTVSVRVTGAVDQLTLTSPAGNPVRVQMQGGAKTVAAGARTLRDVEPGSTLTPKGWATNDRYDVNAEARVTLLSVKTAK
jgi:hypothetical protein